MNGRKIEIDLRELMWKIILGWRFLLICVLVFEIICIPLFYRRDLNTYQEALNQQQMNMNLEEDDDETVGYDFTEEEKSDIAMALSLQQAINVNQNYLSESVLMNIDPYNEYTLLLRYYVDSDYSYNYMEENTLDYTQAVVAAYEEYASSGELAQKLADSLDLDCDLSYVQELITVPSSTQSSMIGINVVYSDEETLEQMAKIIETELESLTESISQSIGEHEIRLLSDSIAVKTDRDLATQQQTTLNMLNSYRTTLNTLKSSMSDSQMTYLNYQIVADEDSDEETLTETETLVKPQISIKYVLYGLLIGIVFGVLWITCKILLMGKLQNSEELTKIFNVRLFGTLKEEKKISAVDRALLNIKNRHQKQLSEEECLNMIVSNIKLTCSQEDISQIYVTGSEIEKIPEQMKQDLQERMKDAGIEIVYGAAVCYDAQSLQNMSSIGSVVILEQVGKSIYNEIEKELRLIKEVQVKIMGGIIIADV